MSGTAPDQAQSAEPVAYPLFEPEALIVDERYYSMSRAHRTLV